MSKEVDYSQFEEFVKKFEKIDEDLNTFLRKFLLKEAQRVVAEAKKRTPVDTGALRNSYYIGSQHVNLEYNNKGKVVRNLENATIQNIDIVGNNLEVTIGNVMEYASFNEYGWALKDGSWKPGHFMLTIGIDIVQKSLPSNLSKEFEQFLKEKGVG